MDRRKVTYKLYPNAKQSEALRGLLYHHNQLYNCAIQERRDAWDKKNVSVTYEQQCAGLTELRNSGPEWVLANCASEQVTLRRVKHAFEAFFRRCRRGENPGYPRFRPLSRMLGFGFKDHGNGWRFTPQLDWKHGKLRLQGIGIIPARGQPRQGGKIKSCELVYKVGVWHVIVSLECPTIERKAGDGACGLDWGVETFAMLALPDGSSEAIKNPRFYRTLKSKEIELERIRDRRKRESVRHIKAQKRCNKLRIKKTNKRLDFHHKVSANLVARFNVIATEKLRIANITRSAKNNRAQKAGTNREVLDTGPTRFLEFISYKAAEAGGIYLEAPTLSLKPSQRCPVCGDVKKKARNMRVHQCSECGHTESRDGAAARVCLNWAMAELSSREPRCAV